MVASYMRAPAHGITAPRSPSLRRRRVSPRSPHRDRAMFGLRGIGTGTDVSTCGSRAAGSPSGRDIIGFPHTGLRSTATGALSEATGSADLDRADRGGFHSRALRAAIAARRVWREQLSRGPRQRNSLDQARAHLSWLEQTLGDARGRLRVVLPGIWVRRRPPSSQSNYATWGLGLSRISAG